MSKAGRQVGRGCVDFFSLRRRHCSAARIFLTVFLVVPGVAWRMSLSNEQGGIEVNSIDVLPSSSGLGHRPLTAKIAGSNPVGSTTPLKSNRVPKQDRMRLSRGRLFDQVDHSFHL